MSPGPQDHEILRMLPWSAGSIAVVLTLTYCAARRAGRHSVIDAAWGLLFCATAVVAFVLSSGHGDLGRRWLLLGMTLLWGLRLSVHVAWRSRGKKEDPRYERMLAGRGAVMTALLVYGLQGALAYLISAPIQVGPFEPAPIGWLAYAGVALWTVGVVFEAVADWQLERYKSDPHRREVMDRGLWRYTRHPNYFGDACVWVGIYWVAAGHWPGVLTVFSPIIMIYLLAFGSGKRVLEQHMSQRPAYQAYMQHTSGFLPLPRARPRHGPEEAR